MTNDDSGSHMVYFFVSRPLTNARNAANCQRARNEEMTLVIRHLSLVIPWSLVGH
jgi:hypothetical protein